MEKKHKNQFYNRQRESKNAAEQDEGLIEGRNAVFEALRSGRTINKVYVLYGSSDSSLNRIREMAKHAGVTVNECDRGKLDAMSVTGAHQGVIAAASAHEYSSLDDIMKKALDAGEPPLIVICDGINDPHNLGAIIRTAGAVGAHGVVIAKRRSVGLTAVVAKAAAGALEYVPVARVGNLVSAIKELKEKGVWIYGTSDKAPQELYSVDLTGAMAVVIGNEGEGMTRLVGENCDFTLSIPMRGHIASLNASNAAAVVLFEAARQRNAIHP